MPKVKLNLSIDEQIANRLKAYALEHGLTVSELIEQWAKERLSEVEDDYGGLPERRCLYCGRLIQGYGAICAECKREPTPEERERMAELWRRAKEELTKLSESKSLRP
jgi:hypothetical protein